MSAEASFVASGWASFRRAWIITRREVRDTMRDWRLMTPIALLTIVFPALMQFTANLAQRWATRWGGAIVGERLIPFLLMIVGFFPISFSLVIALETFAGEKERRSLEPLLATPLTNAELYWGKTLAAMIPPVGASYLGLVVYLGGLFFTLRWVPSFELLSLIVLLTTAEALVMVSGAVVISSQTTSVRAANILASFVIIPMALLVQGESIIMFWANYQSLWWILAALVAIDALLVRMGVRLFNREELLGREIDVLDLKRGWRTLVGFFLRAPEAGLKPELYPARFTLARVYGHDLPVILRKAVKPIALVVLTQVMAFAVGWYYAMRFPVPEGLIALQVSDDAFRNLPDVSFLPTTVWGIAFHNLRVLILGGLLGVFSFGSMAIVMLMITQAIVGFFAAQAPAMGTTPWMLLATFILPHGIVEMPTAILATAMAVRLGAVVISPPPGMTVSQGLLQAAADAIKVLVFLIVPLLLIAAMLEVWLTPWIVTRVW